MAYKGYASTAWARSAATTLARHFREEEQAMLRKYRLLALLEAAGQIEYGCGGEGFDWPVQYRLHNLEGNTGQTPRNFAQRNLWQTASLDYRGYQATDAMYYREFKSNRGPEGIVKVFDRMTDRLQISLQQGLATEPYVDGNAAGNESSWHGFESFTANNGTVTITTGAQRAANVADPTGYPNDTYAGLTTGLGDYGGENETGSVWPVGVADPQYDFWAPMIVNSVSNFFAGASQTWAVQAVEALRWGLIHTMRNDNAMDTEVQTVLLTRESFYDFANLIDDKERILISSELSLRSLGFRNTINFDGVEISWENGVPGADAASVVINGYGFNVNCIELKSMEDGMLLRTEGPVYDIDDQAYKAVVSTLSNLKFKSPRNFAVWKEIKAS